MIGRCAKSASQFECMTDSKVTVYAWERQGTEVIPPLDKRDYVRNRSEGAQSGRSCETGTQLLDPYASRSRLHLDRHTTAANLPAYLFAANGSLYAYGMG